MTVYIDRSYETEVIEFVERQIKDRVKQDIIARRFATAFDFQIRASSFSYYDIWCEKSKEIICSNRWECLPAVFWAIEKHRGVDPFELFDLMEL